MSIVKQSFLSNLLGKSTYEDFSCFARYIVGLGSFILIVLFFLSYFFHSGIVLELLKIAVFSPLLIAYVIACILLLDVRINIEKTEQIRRERAKNTPKPFKYKLTIVWTIILLILGVTVICFSFRYAIKYEFECTTFLVDHKAHLYHSDWNDVCEKMQDAEDLELMHGYEIDDTYSFCKECREAEAWLSREWIHK
jgi:magnesium-transporting ATPase (P-type)